MKLRVILSLVVFSTLAVSCTSENDSTEDQDQLNVENASRYLTNEDIKRHVEGQLNILPSENYDIQIYEEHLDTDDSLDRLITVNLLDRALKEAEAENRVEYRSKMGYVGNYNFIFYVDGKTNVITSAIGVPSSPHYKLKVQFTELTSPTHKDILIDFRVRRSQFRQFYTIRERVPIQVSESELFFGLGDEKYEPYYIELEDTPGQLWKTISVYHGESKSETIDDLLKTYSIEPSIKKTDKLLRRWYFSEKYLKYYLRNDEL